MDKIVWSNKLSVGYLRIDNQHKKLIELINDLDRQGNISVHSETISDALTKMTEYFQEHFELEEKYMLDHDFPGYAEHKAKHIEFAEKTYEFCSEAIFYNSNVPTELVSFLKTWLVEHVLREDMQYKAHVERRSL